MPVVSSSDENGGGQLDPDLLPHDTQRTPIIVCAVICVTLASVFVGLRFYTRTKIINVLGWTDWCLLVALIFSILTTVASIQEASYGLGSHVWDVDIVANFIPLEKAAWFAILWYIVTLFLVKTSILLLYLKIFTYFRTRQASKVVLVLVVLTNIWSVAVTCTACIPLSAFWDLSIQGAYCHPVGFFWANTGMHLATDYLIFLVPLPSIWALTLPWRQKAILVGIFALGFFVCFISVWRLVFLVRLHREQAEDFTYVGAGITYWSLVETNAAIVCACLMTLKPLVARYFPRLLDTTSGSSGSSLESSKPPVARTGSRAWVCGVSEVR